MPKSKIFAGSVLLLVILFVTVGVFAKPMIWSNDDRPVIQLNHSRSASGFSRDSDDNMTFRWMYSSDGGETWHNKTIYGAGSTGMIDTTGGVQSPGWPGAAYDFGVVADGQNRLHFVAVLNSFLTGDLNPLNRRNGVYDVRCSADGNDVSYNLIFEQPSEHEFIWSDVGIDANNNLFAIWVDVVGDAATIWASKSTDGGAAWSAPFSVLSGLNVTGGQASVFPYPHMTPQVDDDFFYIIYQVPVGNVWSHSVLKVPSSLTGNVVVTETGTASGAHVSYYVGSVSPIAMDPNTNPATVYFAVRDTSGKTGIGNLANGEWSITKLPGFQRYPNCRRNQNNKMVKPDHFCNLVSFLTLRKNIRH